MEILYQMFARKALGLCPSCGKDMKDAKFRDNLSKQEFDISGLCQDCQDKIFGKQEL